MPARAPQDAGGAPPPRRVGQRRPLARDDVPRLALWLAGAGAAAVVLVWLLYLLRGVLLLFYVSVLLAAGLGPAVRWVERRGQRHLGDAFSRTLAVLLVYLAGTVLVAALGLMVVPTLLQQATDLSLHMPRMLADLQGWLVARRWLQAPLSVGDVMAQAPVGPDVIGSVLGTVWTVLGGVFGFVTIVVLSIYLLLDADALLGTLVEASGPERRHRVRRMLYDIGQRASAWLSGQLLLGAIIGAITMIALALLGVPYFIVLGVLAGIGELIPYLGPIIAAVPALALAAGTSWQLAALVALFYVILQQFENHILLPRVMAQQVGVSPVVVIVAVLAGGSLWGLTGVILAVPTAAILEILVRQLIAEGRA